MIFIINPYLIIIRLDGKWSFHNDNFKASHISDYFGLNFITLISTYCKQKIKLISVECFYRIINCMKKAFKQKLFVIKKWKFFILKDFIYFSQLESFQLCSPAILNLLKNNTAIRLFIQYIYMHTYIFQITWKMREKNDPITSKHEIFIQEKFWFLKFKKLFFQVKYNYCI